MRSLRLSLTCAALVIAASSLAACTGGEEDENGAPEPTNTEPATRLTRPDAPLKVVIRSAKQVKPADRVRVKAAIARPIAQWFDGAFVEGEYPRATYDEGLRSWTPDAARLARRDRDTTTNAALGGQVVGVVADEQLANVYVFADSGVTGGATARVRLRLTQEKDTGELVKTRVTGAVYLTRAPGGWKIFGYDLDREVVPS